MFFLYILLRWSATITTTVIITIACYRRGHPGITNASFAFRNKCVPHESFIFSWRSLTKLFVNKVSGSLRSLLRDKDHKQSGKLRLNAFHPS